MLFRSLRNEPNAGAAQPTREVPGTRETPRSHQGDPRTWEEPWHRLGLASRKTPIESTTSAAKSVGALSLSFTPASPESFDAMTQKLFTCHGTKRDGWAWQTVTAQPSKALRNVAHNPGYATAPILSVRGSRRLGDPGNQETLLSLSKISGYGCEPWRR